MSKEKISVSFVFFSSPFILLSKCNLIYFFSALKYFIWFHQFLSPRKSHVNKGHNNNKCCFFMKQVFAFMLHNGSSNKFYRLCWITHMVKTCFSTLKGLFAFLRQLCRTVYYRKTSEQVFVICSCFGLQCYCFFALEPYLLMQMVKYIRRYFF